MKQTSKNILNTIEDYNFKTQLANIQSKLSSYKYGESTIGESVAYLQSIIPILKDSITNGILDQIPEPKRKTIWSSINNLKTQASQLARFSYNQNNQNVKNYCNQILTQINNIQDYIEQSNLISKSQGLQDYEEELKNLTKLKKRYNNYLKEIDEAKSIASNLKSIESKASNQLKSIDTNLVTSKQAVEAIKLASNDITSNQNLIDKSRQNILDAETEVNTKKAQISSLYNSSETVTKNIDKTNKDLITLKENSKKSLKVIKMK